MIALIFICFICNDMTVLLRITRVHLNFKTARWQESLSILGVAAITSTVRAKQNCKQILKYVSVQ